ncbi:MAG: phosphoribosylglycinamide formyltransferase [Cyclobacteriaceae bacterium]|nr:phosphoribosylglycinamide formyltransferase [Cyclobacteriaceae bacterium]
MESPKKFNIAIFASGNGTNAEAIIKYFLGNEQISVCALLSNNPSAKASQRAENLDVPSYIFDKPQFLNGSMILDVLKKAQATHIVLAGFLWLIPDYLINTYPIINIHPSLLPKFGGKGMYGSKIHHAVKEAGEFITGITIHEVNGNFDEGKILFQASIAIETSDSIEQIGNKVHALEYQHYPVVIENWILK